MTQKKTPKQDDSVVALIRRTDTEKPNPEDLKRLRDILDENDALVRINETSEMAFTRVIGSYTKSELSKELFKRQIEAKRKSLNYESENVIVQMLINQVILCHIRLNTFEYGRSTSSSLIPRCTQNCCRETETENAGKI